MKIKKTKQQWISLLGCGLIAFVYVLVILNMVVFKNGLTTQYGGLNLIPFRFVIDYLSGDSSLSIILYNLFGNIAIFIPLGILIKVFLSNKTCKQVVLIGGSISLFIELTQAVIGLGIGDIDDLIMNMLGTLLGVILYTKLCKPWDEYWENSFTSFGVLSFLGVSSYILIWLLGYGNQLVLL